MAEFDHSKTILVVKPVGQAALEMLRSGLNVDRLVLFQFSDSFHEETTSRASRKCTSYILSPPEIQLHLRFDPKPQRSQRGFVFGIKAQTCDVVLLNNLDSNNLYGISGKHFYLDFNWDFEYVRLNNISRFGTRIEAPSIENGYQHLKRNQRRMFVPGEQTRIDVGFLKFDIFFLVYNDHQRQLYRQHWETFRSLCQGAPLDIKGLQIMFESKITKFLVRREKCEEIYLLHDKSMQMGLELFARL